MFLTNIANKYIRASSDTIQAFIDDIGSYTLIKMSGTFNCLPTSPVTKSLDTFDGNSWKISLGSAIATQEIITKLLVVNNTTGKAFNVITDPIDLGFIADDCVVQPCTLEVYSSHFTSLFEDAINIPLSGSATVTFVDNDMYVTGLPDGFSLLEVSFSSSASALPFVFGTVDSSTDSFYIGSDGIYILPKLFSQVALLDGVYSIDIKMQKTGSYQIEETCTFIDILTKCRVAAYIVSLSEEAKSNEEQTSPIVHLLHYGLTNASNCGCNCVEMCTVYKELDSILTEFLTTINTDCDC